MENKQFSQKRRLLTGFIIGLLSLVFAFIGTATTAALADKYNWCCVHDWALLHSTGVIVMMLWGLLGFHLLTYAAQKFRLVLTNGQFGILPHIVYLSAALGSYHYTDYFMWLSLASSITVFILDKRSKAIKPYGLFVIGFIVALINFAQWGWMEYLSLTISN